MNGQPGRVLPIRALRWLGVAVVATFSLHCKAQPQEAVNRAKAKTELVAAISLPKPNSLLRADVPVFGKAHGPNFKLWRLEYRESEEPAKWNAIKVGFKPILEDPYAQGKVKWNPNWGAHGNLADWRTGLVSYRYGTQHANLNGVYTLRLVAEDKDGNLAEARVPVEVGRVITRVKGGTANSPDNHIVFSVPPLSCPDGAVVISIQPSDDVKPDPGRVAVGEVYEFRPPGREFARQATLTITYTDQDLDTSGDGKPDVPEDKLAACYYRPVEEYWAVLPAKHLPDQNRFVTTVSSVTPHLAYFAVLADTEPPGAPELGHLPKTVNGSRVAVEGLTEPEAQVCILVSGRVQDVTQADTDGFFSVPRLPLAPGRNEIAIAATDGFGNTGDAVRVLVERVVRPPKAVESVTILGRLHLMQDEHYLVHLRGVDADPEVNTCQARLVSETDPQGIVLELRETAPTSGDYVALFQIRPKSSQARGHLAARRHGETVSAFAMADPQKRATKTYHDIVPPPPPTVLSPSHPSAFQDTFEGRLPGLAGVAASASPSSHHRDRSLAGFRTLDGDYGAVVERVGESGSAFVDDIFGASSSQPANCFARMTRPRRGRCHMGVVAKSTPYSLEDFPIIEFDYRIQPGTKIDLVLHVGEDADGKPSAWYNVRMNDPYCYHRRIGSFGAVLADGKWHHAQANLLDLVSRALPRLKKPTAREIQFVDWDLRGFMALRYGAGAGRKTYCIDNFVATRYSENPDVTIRWTCQEDNGIAGYSFVLDQKPNTLPDETKETEGHGLGRAGDAKAFVERRLTVPSDGRWYFHARAVDGAGNWGAANHYMLVIDRASPLVRSPGPAGQTVDFRTPIACEFDDIALDPNSVQLEVDGQQYDASDAGFAVDNEAKRIVFEPTRVGLEGPPNVPPSQRVRPHRLIFPDGATVHVALLEAKDYLGHPLAAPLHWSYTVKSPLKVEPANPDGKNGWYTTPPKMRVDWKALGAEPPTTDKRQPNASSVSWSTPFTDPWSKRGNSVRELHIRVPSGSKPEDAELYKKQFKLDTTVPETQAVLSPARPDGAGDAYAQPPTITLSHSDYVLWPGSLSSAYYADESLERPLPEPSRRGKAARVSGYLYASKAGEYRLFASGGRGAARKGLYVDDELMKQTEGRAASGTIETRCYLTKGFHKIRVDAVSAKSVTGLPRLLWQPPKARRKEPIPSENQFAERSVATIYYHWDEEEPKPYTGPIQAPAGKHVLHFHAEDEAGHVEKEQELVVNVVGE